MSIEIMLPWGGVREKLHAMKDSGSTHYKIADQFKVPEDVIDLYFDSGYKDLSIESNKF